MMRALLLLLLVASPAAGQGCYWVNGVKICPTSGQPMGGQPIAGQPVLQQAPPAEQLVAITQPQVFEVSVEVTDRDGGNSIGNGVVASSLYGGGAVVLTNAHVVRDRASDASVLVTGADGVISRGYVLAAEEATDLAAIRVEADWAPAPIASTIDIGASSQIRGYHAGRFKKTFGDVVRPHDYGYWVACRVPHGMSGSGVYQRGRLVGVVFGSDGRESSISGIGPIRRLLRRVMGHEPIGPTAARSRPAPVPSQPRPATFPAQPATTYATAPTAPPELPAELAATVAEPTSTAPTTAATAVTAPCDCRENFARIFAWQEEADATLAELSERVEIASQRDPAPSPETINGTISETIDQTIGRQIGQQLEERDQTLRGWVREQLRDKISEQVEDKTPSVATGVRTAAKVYGWTQYIGPAGGIVAAAAGLWAIWSSRRSRREPPSEPPADGRGGPSGGEF